MCETGERRHCKEAAQEGPGLGRGGGHRKEEAGGARQPTRGSITLRVARLGGTSAAALRAIPPVTLRQGVRRVGCIKSVCVQGWGAVVIDLHGLCHPPSEGDLGHAPDPSETSFCVQRQEVMADMPAS